MKDLKEQAQVFLRKLGEKVGISDLKFNDDHVCRLVLDKTLIVDLEYSLNESVLYATCSVASRLPESNSIYKQILSANLFGRGTGTAVLGYDDDKDEVVLFERFDLESVAPESFVERMDIFVGFADHWTSALLNVEDEDAGDTEDDLPASGDSFIRV